ncbi:MAG: hypothetical protein K6E63_08290 [Lachnospiraceae bacterium]|nr:hypothetical protein [Lachnospiraceae bacterium]
MNNFLNKLERRFGKYAIPNLSKYIIFGYVIGYGLTLMDRLAGSSAKGLITFISLDPYMILHGQIWRLITWIIVPPSSLGIFTIIMLLLYYSLGTSLERTWGTFRFNVYIFGGMLFTVIGAFILFACYNLAGYTDIYSAELLGSFIALYFSTYYINLSIFLAFAAEYPDMQLMLYFIIPIKIKWLAILDVVLVLYDFFTGTWEIKVVVIASLLNFAIFYLSTRNYKRVSPKEIRRRQTFKNEVRRQNSITKHKCAICGRTEKDGDNLEFRFCSKCNGNYEYCQDHLFTHDHVK